MAVGQCEQKFRCSGTMARGINDKKEINKSKLIHGLYSLCYVLDCLLKLIGTTSLNFGGWHDRISLKDI